MNPDTRIVNAKTTTKPELIRLNAALAAENAELRNLNTNLHKILTHKITKPVISLNKQTQELTIKIHTHTRVRNGKIEIYLHGEWNDINTIAIPEYA